MISKSYKIKVQFYFRIILVFRRKKKQLLEFLANFLWPGYDQSRLLSTIISQPCFSYIPQLFNFSQRNLS